MPQNTFVDRKLDVLNVLWERGATTVREVHRELEKMPYPAVRALLEILEQEGHVRAEMGEGLCRYSPALTRREFGRQAARRVLRRYFDGSGLAFLHALAEAAGWPEETVRPLWDRLKKAKSESWLSARSV